MYDGKDLQPEHWPNIVKRESRVRLTLELGFGDCSIFPQSCNVLIKLDLVTMHPCVQSPRKRGFTSLLGLMV
jgi:hypothetical protein